MSLASLQCPICHRQLTKNEGLLISHDNIGSLIVRHVIPASVGYRQMAENDQEFERRIAEAPEGVHPDKPMRHTCAEATFTRVQIHNRFGGVG